MKKILTLFSLFLFVWSGCVISSYAQKPLKVYGDVNGDKKVDISDIVSIINTIAVSDTSNQDADVNKDSKIDISDVVKVINIIAGLDTESDPNDPAVLAGICPDSHHPHAIDMGTGVKFSCCNLEASSPEQYGCYYAWAETYTKYTYNKDTYNNEYDGDDFSGTLFDVAHIRWEGGWRTPNMVQMQSLLDNCQTEWTSLNGVRGRMITAPNGNRIFLPAAGYRKDELDGIRSEQSTGLYWLSTRSSASSKNNSDRLQFDNYSIACNDVTKYSGYPVRPVYDENVSAIRLSVNQIDFEKVVTNKTRTEQVSVINDGVKTITFSLPATHGVFEIPESGKEFTIKEGELKTFDVRFYTSEPWQEYEMEVNIISNAERATPPLLLKARSMGEREAFLQCPDDHHPHAIDLGVGVWFSCCNLEASSPEESGGYYAWGETQTKDSYSWDTYLHCGGNRYKCYDIGSDIADSEYDAAHQIWGNGWLMPTYQQLNLLTSKCSAEKTCVNGVDGVLFKGSNGGSIFMPYCGYMSSNKIYDAGKEGGYWSASHYPDSYYNDNAWDLELSGPSHGYSGRCLGLAIRPVFDRIISSVNVTNSLDYGYLCVGDVVTKQITVVNNGMKDVTFSLSATHGAFDVPESGKEFTLEPKCEKILDVSFSPDKISHEYEAEIIFKSDAENSPEKILLVGHTFSCPDNHHPHAVDLGIGVKIACCNVGASAPWERGGYYAWGETEEKDCYDSDNYSYFSWSANPHYGGLGSDIAGTSYDVSFVKWGPGWCMPDKSVMQVLLDKCSKSVITINSTKGMLFNGPNDAYIFLPFGGIMEESYWSNSGYDGYYWTSNTMGDELSDAAYVLHTTYQNLAGITDNRRDEGMSVRPIAK